MKLLKALAAFAFFLYLASPVSAQVQEVQENSQGFASLPELTVVFANVLGVISTLAGFAVLIMFVRGGIAYITAQGDPKAVAAARGTLTWAVIGMIVILASFLIISLLVGFVNLPGLGRFCIPIPGSDASSYCSIDQ